MTDAADLWGAIADLLTETGRPVWSRFDGTFVLSIAAAATLLLQPVPRVGPMLSGLSLPLSLLCLRRVLFFVPFPGTVSLTDQVVVWDSQTYAILLVPVAAISGWMAEKEGLESDSGTLVLVGLALWFLVPVVLSAAILPLDGFGSHVLCSFLMWLTIIKILVCNPLTIWIAWSTLALQLVGIRLQSMRRELNLLAVVLVLCVGVLFQVGSCGSAKAVRDAIDTYPVPAQLVVRKEQDGSTIEPTLESYLGVWFGKVSQAGRTGVLLVDRELPNEAAAETLRYAVRRSDDDTFWMLASFAATIGLLVVSQRIPFRRITLAVLDRLS
jgi:hypothetical protein